MIEKSFVKQGVPVPTFYSWRRGPIDRIGNSSKEVGKFVAVQVCKTHTQTLAAKKKEKILAAQDQGHSRNGYDVFLPGGLKVEAVSLDHIIELTREVKIMSFPLRMGHRIFVFSEYVDLRAGFNKISM